jgi:ketosteroid isomerase-like protein
MRRQRALGHRGAMNNLQKVQTIYEAFGRGDVPTILELCGDDIDWDYAQRGHSIPWLQRRRGRAGVGGFFQAVGEHLDITMFAAKTYCEGQGVVCVLCDIEAKVKPTGKVFREEDEVHVWHFDAAGRIVRFRHAADTLLQQRAWDGT